MACTPAQTPTAINRTGTEMRSLGTASRTASATSEASAAISTSVWVKPAARAVGQSSGVIMNDFAGFASMRVASLFIFAGSVRHFGYAEKLFWSTASCSGVMVRTDERALAKLFAGVKPVDLNAACPIGVACTFSAARCIWTR